MIITEAHVQFWMQKHRPAFGKSVRGPRFPASTIHDCVNDHDPTTFGPRNMPLSNLLSLLRLARNNGETMPWYLYHLYGSPHSDKHRRKWCRRFLRGMGALP